MSKPAEAVFKVRGVDYERLAAVDPATVPIEADLSRNDVTVLHQLCVGKRVVEFGAGGSTLLLARFARSVVSYESDIRWIKLVERTARERIGLDDPVAMTDITLKHVPRAEPPRQIERADVMFVDGLSQKRHLWVERALRDQLAPIVVLHDSRDAKKVPLSRCTSLLTLPHTAWIDRVAYHYEQSNHVVIWLREKAAVYENWNLTEPEGRLPHLAIKRAPK